MLNFDLYAIWTSDNEYGGSIKEFFTSFKEAVEHRMEYANWWCSNGNICIEKYPAGSDFRASDKWYINPDGTIQDHFKWR